MLSGDRHSGFLLLLPLFVYWVASTRGASILEIVVKLFNVLNAGGEILNLDGPLAEDQAILLADGIEREHDIDVLVRELSTREMVMNYKSMEIGWLITDKGNQDYVSNPSSFFGKLAQDDSGYAVPGSEHDAAEHGRDPLWVDGSPLYFETLPDDPNVVFVSWTNLEHGNEPSIVAVEPERFGDLIRKAVGDSFDVRWAIIETYR